MTGKIRTQLLVGLLVGMLVAAVSPLASLPQQSGVTDYTSLSGVWEGRFSLIKIGECSINGSERADFDVQISLDVAADGSFTAIISQDKVKTTRTWKGQLDKDLKFVAVETRQTRCWQQSREYEIRYTGKLKEKKGKFSMEVRGRDDACPRQDCAFNHIYQVKQK